EDASFVIAIWNLNPPDRPGVVKTFDLTLTNGTNVSHALLTRVDADHSNTLAAYDRMGRPTYPTAEQVRALNAETELKPPESIPIRNGHVPLTVPPNGFVLIELAH